MAAAPLPLADPEYSPVSPELALVDADLAAELRERLADREATAAAPAFEPIVVEVVEPTVRPADSAVFAPASDEPEGVDSADDLIVGYDAGDVAPPSEEPQPAEHVDDSIVLYQAAELVPASEEPEGVDSALDVIVGYAAVELTPASHADEVAYLVDAIEPDEGPRDAGATSYPALPAAETRDSDPTDVVLREIRDRLTGKPDVTRRRRLRRRYTVASGVGVLAALAVLMVDLYFGVVQLQLPLPL